MNVLVVHAGGLGDLIVCLPMLEALEETIRPGRLVFAADERERQVLTMAGIPATCVALPEAPWAALWDHSFEVDENKIGGFNLAVELWSSGVREKRWRELLRCRVEWMPYDPGCWMDGGMTERIYQWGVNRLGIKKLYRDCQLEPGRVSRMDAQVYLKGLSISPPYAVVAPGAGSTYKTWPEGNCWELCRRIRKDLGTQVVVILGPVETGRGVSPPPDTADYCCRDWSVADVAAVIGGADVYVGQDSGLSHLAVWTAPTNGRRCPCVLTFCRLNIRAWATTRDWVDIIPMPCATPNDVTVEEVLGKAAARLKG